LTQEVRPQEVPLDHETYRTDRNTDDRCNGKHRIKRQCGAPGGRIVTCEYDYEIYENAKARIQASGLAPWIELRNQSSLEMKIEGTIDLFFSDSDMPIREQEIRRFLPQISPYGLILMHDASSHLKIVREAALKLEQDGLISTVLLPTPRGLVVAQKREGRK